MIATQRALADASASAPAAPSDSTPVSEEPSKIGGISAPRVTSRSPASDPPAPASRIGALEAALEDAARDAALEEAALEAEDGSLEDAARDAALEEAALDAEDGSVGGKARDTASDDGPLDDAISVPRWVMGSGCVVEPQATALAVAIVAISAAHADLKQRFEICFIRPRRFGTIATSVKCGAQGRCVGDVTTRLSSSEVRHS